MNSSAAGSLSSHTRELGRGGSGPSNGAAPRPAGDHGLGSGSGVDPSASGSGGDAHAASVQPAVEFIKSLVPLRFPVLLVDRVLEWVPGERIVAVKCFTADEPIFGTSHADEIDEPPIPMLLEAMVQVAGLTVPKRPGKYVFLLGLDNIEFASPSEPRPQFGDQMTTIATATSVRSKIFVAHAESRVGGRLALAGDVRYIYLDVPADFHEEAE